MTRTRTAAVAIAAALALSSCTGADAPDVDVARTDSPDRPADSPSPSSSSAPATEVASFASPGRSCAEFTGPTVIWDELRVREALTLRSLEPVALEGAFVPGAASVAEVPKGEVPMTGAIRGRRVPARWADQVGWDDRVPVAGATLDPGRYYVFLQGRVTGPASYDGVELTWTDESGAEGSTTWDVRDRYRKDCNL